MVASLANAARAAAVVLVEGSPVGSAVLVDQQHLVTAAHIFARRGRGPGAGDQRLDTVEVAFPQLAEPGSAPERRAARLVELSGAQVADVAVLKLVEAMPTSVLGPAPVSPSDQLPESVALFAYPKADPSLKGVWRQFDVAGLVAGGGVQADWSGFLGSWVGQSGGPVFDTATGTLVGILVEGSREGSFDRFLTVAEVARRWPALSRPWLFAGHGGRALVERRARGQRSVARGGDLFRGRKAAVGAVREWLTSPEGHGLPLVVTGQPGAGKSAVLARAVIDVDRAGDRRGLIFQARDATHDDFLGAIRALTGVDVVADRNALLDAFASQGQVRSTWCLVLDGLDEAASRAARNDIAVTSAELAELPSFRVVVATRPMASMRTRFAPGSLLHRLRMTGAGQSALVDLDTDQYFDEEGLQAVASALLEQHGADPGSPPGCAWISYRAHTPQRRRLAAVIASRAKRNFLVVALAGDQLSRELTPLDPDANHFDEAAIPSEVGEALDKYVDSLSDEERPRVQTLMTALAYVRGSGVSNQLWLALAAALGYPATMTDLMTLRASAAVDLLIETVHEGREPRSALFHQAVADALLGARDDRRADERQLLRLLDASVATHGWQGIDPYWRLHAADHAAAADELVRLVDDVDYVAVADLARLVPLLTDSPTRTAPLLREFGLRANSYSLSRRLRFLALASAHKALPDLQARFSAQSDTVVPRWAHPLGSLIQELPSLSYPARSLALGRVEDLDVVVVGDDGGNLHVWDAASGSRLYDQLVDHTGPVHAVALGRLHGREVIVSAGADGRVCVWDAVSGGKSTTVQVGPRPVHAVAIGSVGGRVKVVFAGDSGGVWVWDPDSGSTGDPWTGHAGSVQALVLGSIRGKEVVVSGSSDRTVRLWDATTGEPLRKPLTGHTGTVHALAIGRVADDEVLVSASADRTLRIWDAHTGMPRGEPLEAHRAVRAVALQQFEDRTVLVSAGDGGAVRTWQEDGAHWKATSLVGHEGAVRGVGVGTVGRSRVIVSAGADRRARIWGVGDGDDPHREPVESHWVRKIAHGQLSGRGVVVSGDDGGALRFWDAFSGTPVNTVLTAHKGPVLALTMGKVGSLDVVVTGSRDGEVRVWDVNSRVPITPTRWPFGVRDSFGGGGMSIRAVVLGRLGDRDVVVSGTEAGRVRVSDALTGKQVGPPLVSRSSPVRAVAVGPPETGGLVLSAFDDGYVFVCSLNDRSQKRAPLPGGVGRCSAVALGKVGDQHVIVTGGDDGAVQMWDAVNGSQIGDPLIGHAERVCAVAIGLVGTELLIASASTDSTIRLWRPGSRESTVLDLLIAPRDLVLTDAGVLCVTAGSGLCAFAHR